MVLRDPVERVLALHKQRREEFEQRGWKLGDVYLELGGGRPGSSEAHERFAGFFNGQAREALVTGNQAKLDYWAGIPERGAALRDEALQVLIRKGATVERSQPGGGPDPRTRALILAHNQIDAELHAYFSGAPERKPSRNADAPPGASPRRSGAVCVLGAPRSGTSLTARILNILGVDLGQESGLMAPAAGNNPSGFWEHEGIVNLNEDILASLADPPPPYLQGWRWPPTLDDGWQLKEVLAPHRHAARAILRGSFEADGLWGWKDPRTSLTLPFWQELVSEMRYVLCVRDPLDVAASLAARDGMSLDEGLRLWLLYTNRAIDHTRGQPRFIICHDGTFSDWREQVASLASFLGRPGPSEAECAAIEGHLDKRLWHHRADQEGAAETAAAALLRSARDLHAELLAQA